PVARSLDPSPAAKTLDTMVGSPLAGIFGGVQYLKPNADPAAGYYAAQYGMALEGIGAGVLGLPMGPLAGPGWRATLESPNTLYVGSGAGSALPTWTNVAGPYSVIGQGGGAATAVRAGPGYSAADVLPLTNTAATSSRVTGTVWDSITATQPTYPGSVIPQSFAISLPNGQSVWVHGNATEHLAEYAQMVANNNPPGVVRLTMQQQLASLQGAVNTATQEGVPYNQLINVGGWELKFAPPRQPGQLPALIHALPTGK
ncbi:hypothetical protein QN078_25205, partial [Ralstonia nicotianae]